jgi:flagellar hook-basal body complex protein FliE
MTQDLQSKVSSELVDAYMNTHFDVIGTTTFTLKINEYSPELNDLLKKTENKSATFITAYNPYSAETTLIENEKAQQSLRDDLNNIRCEILAGKGSDPSGEWEGEPSFLCLGLSLDNAKKMGIKFGQNAIVWSDHSAVPKLILLR